ncbi:Lrp/AsnC family transcriptional regulator [Pseudovibrio sp. Tun.PSC04-5.I4]|uniref:Lrp/AsnC family transcriptional regulator n=1 Tax=Pseudovibrio sp. Tun.PSC04-5.I4 TaxID=1798213 RepID=UPI00088DC5D3|nr:Lrp/AsnC family transcriptional regulator [Pseudovibrio sp. Tun.PSC04-5.I4]SDR22292.1 DNA-binding transcriptional regulator, Lrp family [Pseudovibrio sp. Tun.PSC04-5.I4]
MDDIDQKIIATLRRNARASVSELALELKISRSTVRARMERLKAAGDILGYTVVLRGDVFEQPVRGIMMIKIEGKGTQRIVALLNKMTEITALHTTNGKWDLILELGTDTLTHFDDVLRRVRLIDGIAASETNLLLSTKRSSNATRSIILD